MEINNGDDVRGIAVLLHPHPDYGGNRFHPFIDGLFRRLPDLAISAIRFDFSTAELPAAREEALAALDEGAARWPQRPVILAGYSFGADIVAAIDDERIVGWYLLAPPSATLSASTIGNDQRPKAIAVPEHDQYSPPATIAQVVAGWESTTVLVLPNADHFLGAVHPVVDGALHWIQRTISQ